MVDVIIIVLILIGLIVDIFDLRYRRDEGDKDETK